MAVASATVTAKAGPAEQSTAIPIAGITSLSVDFKRQVVQLYQGNELTGPAKEFDLTGVTTFTITTPGGNAVIVIS
jgi:hypothetical protein